MRAVDVWVLVLLAVVTVLAGILWLRMHAFLVLMLAGLIIAVGTSSEALHQHALVLVDQGKLHPEDVQEFTERTAPKRLASAFGDTAASVGILIALASIIGMCLLESGGAARIADGTLRMVGQRQAPVALAASSFVLGIPVFFDTVFYLMVPLARGLARRVGRNYVLFILAIMAGGSIAHSLVPPTPGPLQVAEILGVDLLTLILAGLVVGALSSTVSLASAWGLNRMIDVPIRDLGAESSPRAVDAEATADSVAERDPMLGPHGPPIPLALVPILLPVVLIAMATGAEMIVDNAPEEGSALFTVARDAAGVLGVVGDKNVALGLGAAVALMLLRWAPESLDRRRAVGEALSGGGVIILITAAGGAFGAMLGQAGIAEAIRGMHSGVPGWMLLPIAFGLTTAIRTLQGSATVAMITSAGILQGLAADPSLPFHPVYLALAIGGGSKPVSWMNDSGFWIMCKMSGMTESEGLRTVSPLTVAMGLSTLAWTMLGAYLVPLR